MLSANVAEKRACCVREVNGKSSRTGPCRRTAFFMFSFFKNYLFFFNVWLCWVFNAARELSVVERSRADSLAVVLLLWAKGSRGGLSVCSAWAGLSCPVVAMFRETNSLRKTMQMMECSLLHPWAEAESPLSPGPQPVFVKTFYIPSVYVLKPTSPNSLKLVWTR